MTKASFYTQLTQNKIEFISPLEDKPWGMHEFTIRALNGHYLRISETTYNA